MAFDHSSYARPSNALAAAALAVAASFGPGMSDALALQIAAQLRDGEPRGTGFNNGKHADLHGGATAHRHWKQRRAAEWHR